LVVLSQIYSKTSAHNFITIYSDWHFYRTLARGYFFPGHSVDAPVDSTIDKRIQKLILYLYFKLKFLLIAFCLHIKAVFTQVDCLLD